MMKLKPTLLGGAALSFELAGSGLGLRNLGPLLQGARAALGPAERIPAKPEAVTKNDQEQHGRQQQQRGGGQPWPGRERRHGNAFRSSSKCGPSRRLGQSPPQTTGVP